MLGDADGVIGIPAADAAAILPLCRAHADNEVMIAAKNAYGKLDWERFNAVPRAKVVQFDLETLWSGMLRCDCTAAIERERVIKGAGDIAAFEARPTPCARPTRSANCWT